MCRLRFSVDDAPKQSKEVELDDLDVGSASGGEVCMCFDRALINLWLRRLSLTWTFAAQEPLHLNRYGQPMPA